MIIPTLDLEISLWAKEVLHVAGVDEAGKGPLAGPVSAGAVIIHQEGQMVDGVRDSKLMSEKQRESVFDDICKMSSGWGVGLVAQEEIDKIGIEKAVKKAMMLALSEIESNFGIKLDFVIVDGSKTAPLDKYNSLRIKKGGLYHYSIAAGSVLAKVTRDRLMKKLAKKYPKYGFEKHVGYPTASHLEAIRTFGPCPLHRMSFEPLKSLTFPRSS